MAINRRTFVQLAGAAALSSSIPAAQADEAPNRLRLWYDRPATDWDEALPIGTGRLGAMVFGSIGHERLQFNEDTLYSEEPGTGNLPLDITPDFEHVLALLRAGDYAEASAVVAQKWTGRSWPCYQPMADLLVDFEHAGSPANYTRELDLTTATSRVAYTIDGITYNREYFASFPDQVIVARFTASQPGKLNLRVRLTSAHPNAKPTISAENTIVLRGQAPGFVSRRTLEFIEARNDQWKYPELWDSDGKRRPFAKQVLYGDEAGGRGTRFESRVRISAPAATVICEGDSLVVQDAREVVLLVSAGTSYNGFCNSPSRQGVDPSIRAKASLFAASGRTFRNLRTRHVGDYQALFNRASLHLHDSGDASHLPTDKRIANFSRGKDASFAALYLQFGRYLTIAGSRTGTQPLNLQGIWNKDVIPPWACGYTTNINLEMNYWPTDTLNLGDCFEPLERLITECSANGTDVAHSMYHRAGWVLHHNTTLWRGAQPVDAPRGNDAMPAFWNMGGAWLCQHLWDHYLYTRDRDFLARCYPVIKGAAEFVSDWLIENADGKLVTPVGCSPENVFKYRDKNGAMKRSGICMGPTMDIAITRQIFRNCIAAASTLGVDEPFRQQMQTRIDKLLPYAVGSRGQLQEWPVDFEEEQPQHRHVSHLYGVYPDDQITSATPALLQAARRSLDLRGDEGTGWSRAWKICVWARFGEGNRAYKLTRQLFKPAKSADADSEAGGLMPNMFCSCPPMQIDGNFGGAAGIVEMLLQSDKDTIHLLPAVPDAWPNGRFQGFKTRTGCEVSAEWKGGKLVSAEITPLVSGSCHILYAGRTTKLTLRAGQTSRI